MIISSLFSPEDSPSGDVPPALDALEESVLAWMKTSAAWDQRKHPTIFQFLRDIRLHTTAICCPGNVSTTILNLELDRLGNKVCCSDVDARIGDLRRDLSNRHIVAQFKAANADDGSGSEKLAAQVDSTTTIGGPVVARQVMSQLSVGDLVKLEDDHCEMLVVGCADEPAQVPCGPPTLFCVWECDHRMFEEVFAEDMLRLLRKERRRIPRASGFVFPSRCAGGGSR